MQFSKHASNAQQGFVLLIFQFNSKQTVGFDMLLTFYAVEMLHKHIHKKNLTTPKRCIEK